MRHDWEVVPEYILENGSPSMWRRNLVRSKNYYLIEELANRTFNVMNQNEDILSNHRTLQGAKTWVGTQIKKSMVEIARNINGLEFEKILEICKKMYPRRKYQAYSLQKDENGITRYVIKYNLNTKEYKAICESIEALYTKSI